MRERGEAYLPKWPNEEEDGYKARLRTATLFPAYRRTVDVMAGKPFAKPLTLGDIPEAQLKQWEPWTDDIDRQGVSLNVFASEMLTEAIGHGFAGIYVDMPPAANVATNASGQVTRAAETKAGMRPYFVRVMHHQILGWRLNENGALALLRFRECAEIADGEYGTQFAYRVRVLRPGSWELWERLGEKEYTQIAAGTTSLKAIPFVPVYGKRKAYMVGTPPLIDLAYLNVKHWQSQSDQDTILNVARVPILAMIGADDETHLTVGATSAVKLPINAEMKYIEHSGAAISAGAESLVALEEQMTQTGAELLVQKPGQRTATEDANDTEGNKCDLQRLAEQFEDSLDQALAFAGQYVGMEAPKVTLFKDYGAATLSDASAQIIVAMQQGGIITKKTAITEQQRRGILSPDIDPEVEIAEAEAEGPPPGTLGMGEPAQGYA